MAFNRPEHDSIAAGDQYRASPTESASHPFHDEVYSRPPQTQRESQPYERSDRLENFRATNAAFEMVHLGEGVFNKISGGDGIITTDDIRNFRQHYDNYAVPRESRVAVAHLMYSMMQLDERTAEDKANGLSPMVTWDGLLKRISQIRPQISK